MKLRTQVSFNACLMIPQRALYLIFNYKIYNEVFIETNTQHASNLIFVTAPQF